MKLKRSDLKAALEVVKPGLVVNGVLEQSDSFAFVEDSVVTFNQELSISHPIEGMDITGAVKADELYGLLAKLKAEELDISTTAEELLIKSERTKAGLRLFADITLPLDQLKNKGEWIKLDKDFLKALRFTMASCANQTSRPVLQNIHIHQTGLEASDGFRVSRYNVKTGLDNVLLRASSAIKILQLNPVEVTMGGDTEHGDSWIHFRNEAGTIISCMTTSEEYPNTDTVVKVKGESITFPKAMDAMIDRAHVFSKDSDFLREKIEVVLDKRVLKMRAESETGWIEDSAPIRYDGEAFTFNVIPYLFKDILQETQTCILGKDRVKFETEDWVYVAILLA